ncbi:MAG: hypothetical protein IPK19_38185 [Chloroflexi bacterium]|nr:hypothetical protein [Chloroflexota bacterium]
MISVQNPPTSGTGAGDNAYVEVSISAEKPAYFVQLVYRDPLRVTGRAVGYCDPAFNPATMPPIWAGSRTCSDTVNWTGSGGYVEGGIFSNNEIKFGGGGQGNVIVGPTEAHTAVQTSAADNATFDPAPVIGVDYQDDPLSHYRLGDFAVGGSVAARAAIFKSITSHADDPDYNESKREWALNGSKRTLEGLYYVDGDVVLGNGLTYGVNGVTIVATGAIKGSGGAMMRYYIDGLLFISGAASSNCGDNGSTSAATTACGSVSSGRPGRHQHFRVIDGDLRRPDRRRSTFPGPAWNCTPTRTFCRPNRRWSWWPSSAHVANRE